MPVLSVTSLGTSQAVPSNILLQPDSSQLLAVQRLCQIVLSTMISFYPPPSPVESCLRMPKPDFTDVCQFIEIIPKPVAQHDGSDSDPHQIPQPPYGALKNEEYYLSKISMLERELAFCQQDSRFLRMDLFDLKERFSLLELQERLESQRERNLPEKTSKGVSGRKHRFSPLPKSHRNPRS